MLDRVAVHQTRLRTPGLGLDAKGVALGAKGLVLLPSLDRLVAFLALYTRGGSLEDILRSLSVEIVVSKLGAREVTLTFAHVDRAPAPDGGESAGMVVSQLVLSPRFAAELADALDDAVDRYEQRYGRPDAGTAP